MAHYTIQDFKFQHVAIGTQAAEGFKKICKSFADSNDLNISEYGTVTLPDSAILKAIIANRNTQKYKKIISEISKEFFQNAHANGNFSQIILAALSFLPNSTTVRDLLPLLEPFDLWQDLLFCNLRGMVEQHKIYNVELCAGLDNICQVKQQ